jgi:hypothetical protein
LSAKETRTAFPRISPLPLIAELNPCILSPRAILEEFLPSLTENLFALHELFDKHNISNRLCLVSALRSSTPIGPTREYFLDLSMANS